MITLSLVGCAGFAAGLIVSHFMHGSKVQAIRDDIKEIRAAVRGIVKS